MSFSVTSRFAQGNTFRDPAMVHAPSFRVFRGNGAVKPHFATGFVPELAPIPEGDDGLLPGVPPSSAKSPNTSLAAKVTANKTDTTVRPYMNFFPSACRFFLEVREKVKKIWKAFVAAIVKAWHWVIGYKPEVNIKIHTPESKNLITDCATYRRLVRVDSDFSRVAANLEQSSRDMGVDELARQAYEALAPNAPQATHIERIGLVLTALWLDRLPFLAATGVMLRGLDNPSRLEPATRIAGDFLVLGAADALASVLELAPVNIVLRTGMIFNLVVGEMTDKSLSQHVQRWVISKLKASEADRATLKGLRMPASASNEEARALERVQIGTGTRLDVLQAAEGLFRHNELVLMGKKLDAQRTAVRIHNAVAAIGLGGVVFMVTSNLSSRNGTRLVVPLLAGAARWFVPSLANVEHRAYLELRDRFPVIVDMGPAMSQALMAANGASMLNSCLSLGYEGFQVLNPVVSASVIFLPTAQQVNRFREGEKEAVVLDIVHGLPARVSAYMFANALLGPVAGAMAVAGTSFVLEDAADQDGSLSVIKKAHTALAGAGALALVAQQTGLLTGTLSTALPFVAAVIPSASQVETFQSTSRVSAVGQWAIAALGKVVVVYLVKETSEYVIGPGTGMAALAAVTVTKPIIDKMASTATAYIGAWGSRVWNVAKSVCVWGGLLSKEA